MEVEDASNGCGRSDSSVSSTFPIPVLGAGVMASTSARDSNVLSQDDRV